MSSCPICLEPELKVPAACVPCGHTFCHACIMQWTRSPPRFGLSLCPQCRAPVIQVQKLFISDWPIPNTGGSQGQGTLSQLSPWQHFLQLVTVFVHFLFIPYHALARYGPEMGRRLSLWFNQQIERLAMLRIQLRNFAAICHREWVDLGLPAQVLVGAAVLLIMLLLVQDLQDQDGIHRGIVLPILLVFVDIIKQLFTAGVYLLCRPLSCFLACFVEVALAVGDVGCVLGSALLWVVYDVISVPWLLLCVVVKLLCAGLTALATLLRICMFCLVITLALGVPTFLAAPNDQPLRTQLPEIAQAVGEWLRQKLLHHAQQAAEQRQETPVLPGRVRENILRDFFRILSEELRRSGTDSGEEEEDIVEVMETNVSGDRNGNELGNGAEDEAAREEEALIPEEQIEPNEIHVDPEPSFYFGE